MPDQRLLTADRESTIIRDLSSLSRTRADNGICSRPVRYARLILHTFRSMLKTLLDVSEYPTHIDNADLFDMDSVAHSMIGDALCEG